MHDDAIVEKTELGMFAGDSLLVTLDLDQGHLSYAIHSAGGVVEDAEAKRRWIYLPHTFRDIPTATSESEEKIFIPAFSMKNPGDIIDIKRTQSWSPLSDPGFKEPILDRNTQPSPRASAASNAAGRDLFDFETPPSVGSEGEEGRDGNADVDVENLGDLLDSGGTDNERAAITQLTEIGYEPFLCRCALRNTQSDRNRHSLGRWVQDATEYILTNYQTLEQEVRVLKEQERKRVERIEHSAEVFWTMRTAEKLSADIVAADIVERSGNEATNYGAIRYRTGEKGRSRHPAPTSVKGGCGTTVKFRLGTARSTPQNLELYGRENENHGGGYQAVKNDYRGSKDRDSGPWGWRMWIVPKFNDHGAANALRTESAQERLEHVHSLNRTFTLEQDKAIVEYANEFCWNHNRGSQVRRVLAYICVYMYISYVYICMNMCIYVYISPSLHFLSLFNMLADRSPISNRPKPIGLCVCAHDDGPAQAVPRQNSGPHFIQKLPTRQKAAGCSAAVPHPSYLQPAAEVPATLAGLVARF
jgi:hypothetical protein